MVDFSVTVGRPPIQVILGENTTEARRQALLAQKAAEQMTTIATAEGRASLYGIIEPTLVQAFGAAGIELDFAGNFFRKGHEIAATLADLSGLSFARVGAATFETRPGAIQNFADGAPRFVPGIGICIEPAAQNMLLRSREFDHAAWDKINAGSGLAPVVVANDAAAPDGTMTADRITLGLGGGNTAADRSHLQQDVAPVGGNPYAGSLWVKGAAGQKIVIRHVEVGGYLLHAFDGKWQRIVRIETASGPVGTFEFGLRGGSGTGDAVAFHAWGGQLETGSLATSYVPSGEFSGARGEDTLSLDGLNLTACTIIVDAVLTSGGSDTAAGRRVVFTLYQGTGAGEKVTLVNEDEGGFAAVVETGGVVTGVTRLPDIAAVGNLARFALRLATDDTLLAQDGDQGSWRFDIAVPPLTTKLMVGGSPASTLARVGGVIRRIAVIPYPMGNREIVANTGGAPDPAGVVDWQRVYKDGGFPHRDSGKTFYFNGFQYLAGGYSIDGDRHDLRRSSNGEDFSEIVNADPFYDAYSQVIGFDGKIYAWAAKMFASTNGGATFAEILPALPWGTSDYDNRAIVYDGKLLFFHGTGDAPGAFDGVWQFDPVAVGWTRILAAPWGGRYASAVGEYQGKLYLYGGYRNGANVPPEQTYPDKTTLNDLWELQFVGGVLEATQIVEEMPCTPRAWPSLIADDQRFYLLGGYDTIGPAGRNYDETWVCTDVTVWAQIYAKRRYLQRHAASAYRFNGTIYLLAGNANAAAPTMTLNDLWRLVL